MKGACIAVVRFLSIGTLACGDVAELTISAGAPVTAAVEGIITECRTPVPKAEVVLLLKQAEPGQARPVDAQIGPVITGRRGEYFVELGPPFAVPGLARVRLRVTPPGEPTRDVPGGILELRMGRPAQDTVRLDADLGVAAGLCP